MAKYQQYAEYKDSGVEWLGEIPNSWIATNLKRYCQITDGSHHSPSIESEGLPFVSVTDVGINEINFIDAKKISNQAFLRLVKEGCKPSIGDILLTKDGTIGRACIITEEMPEFVILSSLGLITPSKHLINKYLYYFLISGINIDQMNSVIHGSALRRMTISKINDLVLVYPLLKTEQTQIANFLDHETAKIDSLIEKQQQLIQLLKEKRQAVISHAVTKGLNSNVPMKDSGVEWLGQVPEHWDTTKIKYVAELTPKKSEVSSNDNRLCTFVPMEKLKLGSLIKDEEKPISEVIGGYTYFKNGDLLLAKVTPCFENKNMVVASDLKNGIGFGSSEIYVLRTNHKVNTQFLYYRLQEDQFMELGTGAMTGAGGLKRVPSEFLNNFEFALPPLSEQIAITKYLNQYLIKNEYLMNKAQSAIQLMQERRTALISAAVTGKIDVRNWQNPNKNNEAKTELSA